MHVPGEPDRDPDLVIAEALRQARAFIEAAISSSSATETQDGEPCWWCGRKVGIDYLIAGYDTFEEQRLACLDCDRTIRAIWEKGYELRLPAAPTPDKGQRTPDRDDRDREVERIGAAGPTDGGMLEHDAWHAAHPGERCPDCLDSFEAEP